MLSRFSVKRPYVIIVAVIICLIVGGVSLSKMKTDLLPEMDLPYMAVITTDPGASAEKVEKEVTNVLEGSLSKVSGVTGVASTSSDNFSMIFLSFEDGTDMDSALVKISSAVNMVSSQLPETAGSPNYLEMSSDMMATLYVAVTYEGKDIYEISEFNENTLVPQLMRVDGVADVSTNGDVERTVEVRLNDDKIEQINNKILSNVNSSLYEAKAKIDEGKAALADAEAQIEEAEAQLSQQQQDTFDELGVTTSTLTSQIASLQALVVSGKAAGQDTSALEAQVAQLQSGLAQANSGGLSASLGFSEASAQLATSKSQIESSKNDLAQAEEQYNASREQAIQSANINQLVDKNTLSQIISAQDFSMPAGYINSTNENEQWLLRVGTELTSVDELESLLLVNIDGVGDIRLSDVADVTVIDNVGEAYLKLNHEEGVILSVFKNSTANTSEVSHAVQDKIEQLEEKYLGLEMTVMSDQGAYIDLFISSILRSLLLGALLAVVVLALFLRDWKPTVIVAFSIPFSVLLALVFMYFSGISLNVMTLGGISIAIGMLVDNSIIVLENIYRLRARGIPAPRAAVQGAKQMAGAVVASTLTTVCVFAPIVFTEGLVNQLMLPFSLTIAFVLAASLLIALTLVPTVSSFIFRSYVPRNSNWFDKLQDKYARALSAVLRHKVIPLVLAGVLLVASVVGVVNMGITLIPTMTSKTIEVSAMLPEETTKEEAFPVADAIMDTAMSIEGVDKVGAMDGNSSVSMVADFSSGSGAVSEKLYSVFSFYITTDESVTEEAQVIAICDELTEKTKDLDVEIITSSSSEDTTSSMVGSGLSINVKGDGSDTDLVAVTEDIMALVDEVEGYTEIDNGLEEANTEITLNVDRDKLSEKGLTVAQLYAEIADRLSTTADSSTLEVEDIETQITIVDETKMMNADTLLDTEIEVAGTGDSTTAVRLGDVATVEMGKASNAIKHSGGVTYMTVTAEVEDGYNNALLSRELSQKLAEYEIPEGYSYSISGEIDNINTMVEDMLLLMAVGFVLIYLVMVAQFQSLLSPFIILFTVPLAFTGGFLGLFFMGEQLNMLALMGFAVLMGTVVNNGIVFVDFVNQLRRGGLEKRDALIAAGRIRIRPILMTALTTILAMLPMILSTSIGASMERGMAIVVVGGLIYATFMTLFIVPIVYDLLYRKVPREVDLGDENLDEDVNDAQEYLISLRGKHAAPEGSYETDAQGNLVAKAHVYSGRSGLSQDGQHTSKKKGFWKK
ncbi:MAG: efflux RND transporter permease subunit [Anaerotardibacter sp.]